MVLVQKENIFLQLGENAILLEALEETFIEFSNKVSLF
jgi:hypothetical protein